MLAPTPSPMPRLWTPSGFRSDDWRRADDAAALAGNGRFILPLAAVANLHPSERRLAKDRLGVLVQPGEPVESLVALLPDLSLVALAFPVFNDGRSFSKAELLRSRYGFDGAIRAVGQILVDQLPHMFRLGFDEFEVSDPVLLGRLERGETGGIAQHYQPTAVEAGAPDRGAPYSWRRSRRP
ncbi:MAG: DUF934 domain-containing protein [Rhizobiaceae bacterium]|nr:MAG: DUF934 domain-containing protein [Rhizobiaceae bacterium]CAG1011447.1 hypothetical protein RHIZO_04026 [Rhizobiaceae bacterium]